MGDGGVIALAKIIAPRQDAKTGTWMFGGSIQELGLSENQIGVTGATAIAKAITPQRNLDGSWSVNVVLKRLLLASNHVGTEGGIAMAKALQPIQDANGDWFNASSLVALSLADNEMEIVAGEALYSALLPKKNPSGRWVNYSMRELLLNGNDGTNVERAVQPALEASAVVRHHMNGVPNQVSIHSTGLVKSIEDVELLLKENVA
mmetsp:Transcript_405/g.694  ORF Transcript_405/g.694 Transcript_405/m.694 type:complete len:205 (-) Transcript_405:72-686(-)|eukprot:CAMPEP_0177758816 /NCGR_PEP_ID=MMETSP0491_2-20121128/4391_1 /TAXON_ID=63592 /ORGANISM="Tetraselmis chuii, Strain PLY429" /LENGTH=204 /DNA_ID=CAMNT_0019274585 /DNA_START=856 /DNA_END=1470 /DNA_ORIENTATION=+